MHTLNQIISFCGIESEGMNFVQRRPINNIISNFNELFSKGNTSTLEKFKEILTRIKNDQSDFLKFLKPVKSSFDLHIFSVPKSLCQILLMVSDLNNFIIEILIENICELSQTNLESDDELAILCLDQFKSKMDSKNMTEIIEKLFDVGYVANNTVQNHLISILTDVSKGHCKMLLARKLYDWMSSDNSLIPASLDVINKLDLPIDFLKDVELLITKMLDTATMITLPSVVSFLIKCTDKANQLSLIDKIRLNIEFDNLQSMFSSAISSTPISNESSSAIKLVNSIKINLQFNPWLRKAWLKSISSKFSHVRSQNFDFMILLIIFDEYKTEGHLVVSLFKLKISAKQFQTDTIETLFKYHLSLLKPLFGSFLSIMNSILTGTDGVFVEFVKMAYLQCFLNPTLEFCDQDIFDSLIVDMAMKPRNVIDGVFEVLKYLANNCRDKVQLFYSQITGLLTNLRDLKCSQVYSIYCVLGIIAFQDYSAVDDVISDRGTVKNNVIDLIRKQLQNPNFIVKRNGGIGAVTIMKYIANQEFGNSDSMQAITTILPRIPDSESDLISYDSEDIEVTASQRVVTTILKLLLSYSESTPELIIVVFDELYRLISLEELTSVEKDINKIIKNSFQDIFITALSSENPDFKPMFGLVGGDYCDVAIAISKMKKDSIQLYKSVNIHLPAHFRLLALFEFRSKDNKLTAINALLGCPILVAGKFERADPVELLTFINWLIEVVNAFSSDVTHCEIDNYHSTMIQRMKLIVSQIANLEMCLSTQTKPIHLPTIQVSSGSNLTCVIEVKKLPVKRKSIKSIDKKSKAKKATFNSQIKDITQMSNPESEEELFDLDETEGVQTNTQNKILKENLCLCYREIDLAVYGMLSDLSQSYLESLTNTTDFLDWDEQNYFLLDLWLKIKHCLRDISGFPGGYSLPSSQKNSMLFRYIDQLGVDKVIQKIIDISPLFKLILKNCIEMCDGIDVFNNVDDPCFRVMDLVLKILAKVFHFLKTYTKDENAEMAENLLHSLAKSQDISLVTQIVSIKNNIPNINIAASYCELLLELLAIPTPDKANVSIKKITALVLETTWTCSNLANYKLAVSKLFEIHLSTLKDKWFDVISQYIIPQMHMIVSGSNNHDAQDANYACLNKNTILIVFKQVSEFILKKCKYLSNTPHSQRNSLNMLESWEKITNIAKAFTKVIADEKDSNMILCFIKFSREYIKFVIKNLMPILDNMLRHENSQVIQLLSGIQVVTRFVQRLCTHCKSKNILSSASLVPQVRRYLETFMFRVKKMMCINKCPGDSINILLLANKDLHGQRIEESVDSDNGEEASTVITTENDAFDEDLGDDSSGNENLNDGEDDDDEL